MLLIGEVSKISQVSLRMLRYYDKNDLFKPGIINEENGYRYYTADQLDELYEIVELRDLGFSVAEIREMIKEKDREKYLNAVRRKKQKLEEEAEQIQRKLKRLSSIARDVEQGKEEKMNKDITLVLKEIPDKDVISYRKVVKNYFEEGKMWREFGKRLEGSGVSYAAEGFSLYHDTDYREEQVDIELCITVNGSVEKIPDGLIHRQVPGCKKAASLLVKGAYENISFAFRRFAHWLEQHPEYHMGGPARQICHVSHLNTENPEEYVTEILIPVEG